MTENTRFKNIVKVPLLLSLVAVMYLVFWVIPGPGKRMSPEVLICGAIGSAIAIGGLFLTESLYRRRRESKKTRHKVNAAMSYNPVDGGYAKTLIKNLSTQGVAIDVFGEKLNPIEGQIHRFEGIDFLIVILSKEHWNSNALKAALKAAALENIRVLCIQRDDNTGKTLSGNHNIQLIDFEGAENEIASFAHSLDAVVEFSRLSPELTTA